ncbi:hypothetical protein [Chryseotalea sanaruensis]|uniref:hypothetical protein n=1 Tax=Chryseotalea sanaruensis TaxID=2482724 RepID=UPI000F8DFACF|nr:hypothetical protein [Chryseotalea sanaruensis]
MTLTSCGERKIDYRDYYDIKDNVKKIELKNSLNSDSSKVSYKEIWTFNEDGQLMKKESFSFDNVEHKGKLIGSTIYSYEDKLLKFEDILDSVGETNLKYEFIKHDDRGFPIEYKLIKGENAVNRMVCSFEKDSKKVLSYDKELLVDRYTTFYDNEKNVIAEKLEWLYCTNPL